MKSADGIVVVGLITDDDEGDGQSGMGMLNSFLSSTSLNVVSQRHCKPK